MVKCLSCQNCIVYDREIPLFKCRKKIQEELTYADVTLDAPCDREYKPYKAMKDLIEAL